jgi:hypothetical protein
MIAERKSIAIGRDSAFLAMKILRAASRMKN